MRLFDKEKKLAWNETAKNTDQIEKIIMSRPFPATSHVVNWNDETGFSVVYN